MATRPTARRGAAASGRRGSIQIRTGHALDDPGELAGDDVARHQRELGPGRLVDPDDPAPERLGEGVEVDADRVARRDAGQAGLLQVGLDVEQVRVVHAQHGDARRGEVAQVAVPLDDHAGERGADLGVREVVLGGLQRPPASSTDCSLTLTSSSTSRIWSLPSLREVDALGGLLFAVCAASSERRATSTWVRAAIALASLASASSTWAWEASRDWDRLVLVPG